MRGAVARAHVQWNDPTSPERLRAGPSSFKFGTQLEALEGWLVRVY